MKDIFKIVVAYYKDSSTIIYRNWIDALTSTITFILLPFLSIFLILSSDNHSFWQYSFPLLSIALTGICDSVSRYDGERKTIVPKVTARIVFDALALILACSISKTTISWLFWIPPVILILSGMFLLYDAWKQIHTTILISGKSWLN